MEAATPQRAAIRLAAAFGGVLLTLTLVVATAFVLALRFSSAAGPIEMLPAAPVYVAADPIAPYRLPLGVDASWHDGVLLPSSVGGLAFEPPAYAPHPSQEVSLPAPVEPAAGFQDSWSDSGSITHYHPAAYGPPEDDTVPGLPTTQRPPGAGFLDAPSPSAPKTTEWDHDRWDEPPGVATGMREAPPTTATPDATVSPVAMGSPVTTVGSPSLVTSAAPSESSPVHPASRPRNLRELAAADHEALLSYTASTKDLSRRLEGEVQAGFELGKSGAVYAARAKFVEVLRKIALAKDAAEGSTRHATALAEGLRKLDEADDFIPKGDALEAELDVAAIANSHGVRLVGEAGPTAPHEALAQYSQHSAVCLAESVADEPAGSMALYGLGKSYARLEAQGGDTTAGRKSLVMYRAAIDAHPENFLAANELGVRLAQGGRYEQASVVLRTAASQPGAIATVHANLAAIEERLGRDQAAANAKQESQLLAQRERLAGEVSRRHGVEWVGPEAFRQAAPAFPPPATTGPMTTGPMTTGPSGPSGWQAFVDRAKRATGWSKPPAAPLPAIPPPATQPTAPPVVANQPRVYR